MTCNGNRRQGRRLVHGRVYSDDAFDSALRKHLRISVQQYGIVTVHNRQKEIIALSQILLNAADDWRTVRVADLFRDHSDGVSALVAQRARKKIRLVVEFLGGRVDSILGFLRNRTRRWRIVQNR